MDKDGFPPPPTSQKLPLWAVITIVLVCLAGFVGAPFFCKCRYCCWIRGITININRESRKEIEL